MVKRLTNIDLMNQKKEFGELEKCSIYKANNAIVIAREYFRSNKNSRYSWTQIDFTIFKNNKKINMNFGVFYDILLPTIEVQCGDKKSTVLYCLHNGESDIKYKTINCLKEELKDKQLAEMFDKYALPYFEKRAEFNYQRDKKFEEEDKKQIKKKRKEAEKNSASVQNGSILSKLFNKLTNKSRN